MTDVHADENERREGDVAPGDEEIDEAGVARGARSYMVGLALAALLTGASFYFATSHVIWGPAIPAALIALAVGQMGVHLVFFLHLSSGPDSTNNALALAFGVLIVILVIGGTVWIMGHLNQNMPSMSQIMRMQQR